MRMTAAGTNGRFLEVRAEIPPDLPRLMGDARALRQIAINLVSNARKYTASSGHIILRADLSSNGGILFEVVDTGIGIPEEEIARVVEPFEIEYPALMAAAIAGVAFHASDGGPCAGVILSGG